MQAMISMMNIKVYKSNENIYMSGIIGFQKLIVVIEGELVKKSNGVVVASKGSCFG